MKLKLWLNIATFVAVGIIIFFGWHDIMAAFEKMFTLNLGVLALVIPAQLFSFFAFAMVYRELFKTLGQPVQLKTLLASVIELNFVNHIFPSGGVSGFSYLTMRLKHDGVSPAKSTLAQLMRYVLTFLTFIGLLLLAVVLLSFEDKASRMIIFVATALTFTILFSTIAVVYIIGSEARIKAFTRGLAKFLNKIIYFFRRSHPEVIHLGKVEKTFHELHQDYILLKKDFGKMKKALIWAFVGNIAEVSLIYITFVAHGVWVDPGAVIIAYGIATLVGLLAILPGGLGVYEPLMAATLLSAGVPSALALSATLVSRVVTLLMALGLGYMLYHGALKRHARHHP